MRSCLRAGRSRSPAAATMSAWQALTAEQERLTAELDAKTERWVYLNDLKERIDAAIEILHKFSLRPYTDPGQSAII